ncbi:hypothetical protein D3C87_1382950 [compost metagenome]
MPTNVIQENQAKLMARPASSTRNSKAASACATATQKKSANGHAPPAGARLVSRRRFKRSQTAMPKAKNPSSRKEPRQ